MNKVQILVIEDDIAVGNLITTTLEMENYQFRPDYKKAHS